MNKQPTLLLKWFAILAVSIFNTCVQASLSVPIEIKEVQSVGSQGFPVSVVVPLPYGEFDDTDSLFITDRDGNELPSAIKVLNRWWSKDNSIRHIQVFIQPNIEAYNGPNTGIKTIFLRSQESADADRLRHPSPVTVYESDSNISVNTGPLQFSVSKDRFNLIEDVTLNDETLLGGNSGHVVFTDKNDQALIDANRNNVNVVIEEHNDLRVVIKAESYGSFENKHTHGFAVRIYAYAGKEYVKVDYQLQNSPIDSQFAGPLYYQGLSLNLDVLVKGKTTTKVGLENNDIFVSHKYDNVSLKQIRHDAFLLEADESTLLKTGSKATGFISISGQNGGVMATTRNFWQMWPNGLSTSQGNALKVELFPKWSAQWHQKEVSKTGLYWLDDMQHVYKEVLLYFHDANTTDEALISLAKTFAFPPTGTIEPSWYAETRATLDLGGYVSENLIESSDTSRTISYNDFMLDSEDARYNFNVENFLVDVYRKQNHSIPGNYPYSGFDYIATRNPKDYYLASHRALGELNVRPQWLAGYSHDKHQQLIKPTSNPYGGMSWRRFINHQTSHLQSDYIEGTSQDSAPRGDQHGWFYHVEDSYYLTGNLWIKDWYQFIAQFRRTRLLQLDPFPAMATRAQAHALAHALQAYKVTGDTELLSLLVDYVWEYIEPEQHKFRSGALNDKEASFQLGFMTRFLINLYHEIDDDDVTSKQRLFNIIAGNVQWNTTYANFGYYIAAEDGVRTSSSGSGSAFVDPQAWYALQTGYIKYYEHITQYLNEGFNGGSRGYRQLYTQWSGDYYGRISQVLRESNSLLGQPALPVTDLSLEEKDGCVTAKFTLPEGAQKVQLIASDKPIAEDQTLSTSVNNWWAGQVIAREHEAGLQESQQIQFNAKSAGSLYVAALYTDNAGRMSQLSNQANLYIEDEASFPKLTDGDAQLLVDFGSSEQTNSFDVNAWDSVISDVYNRYVTDGITIGVGSNGNYNYQGVKGVEKSYLPGDVIAVQWINTAEEVKVFIPQISFTDPDRMTSGKTGIWYSMSAVKIQPGERSISVFIFDENTAGTYSLVNTSVNINQNQAITADKIFKLNEPPFSPPRDPLAPFLFNFSAQNNLDMFEISSWYQLDSDLYTQISEFGFFASSGRYNFQSVKGLPITVQSNMKVVAHWRNMSDSSVNFTPMISFNDPDRLGSGDSGDWLKMQEVIVSAGTTVTSEIHLDTITIDTIDMINVSSYSTQSSSLILTGIQIVSDEPVVNW